MTSSAPLILYDISSPLQPHSYAPNPSKSRLALSLKHLPFKTTWVDIPSIPSVRHGLSCPAVRKLDDGSDFFTLPILQDPTSGAVVGDSFDIANYLDDTFPDSGSGILFPPDSTGTKLDYDSPFKDTVFFAPLTCRLDAKNPAYARFNIHVDATFSAHVLLVCEFLPMNPDTAEEVKALFVKRAHLRSWDDIRMRGEAREQLLAGFQKALASLAELFAVHEDGPYLEGKRANYADLIVGGWLNMFSATMQEEEWTAVRTWHGGVFARLHDALRESYWECK